MKHSNHFARKIVDANHFSEGIFHAEKLLANGDRWEPMLAANLHADAPYR